MENREIRFRVWDTFNKRMCYDPYHFRKSDDIDRMSDDKKGDASPFQFYEQWQDVDDGIARPGFVMQFTNLLDWGGAELWDKDIVNISSDELFEIGWLEDMGCWAMFGLKTGKVRWFDYSHRVRGEYHIHRGRIEKKGNRFENPELLEGTA